ncbi:hypothetical protein [Alkalicoccus urumqiensis]|uniref:Uncharacterized protein n=1 Tax=Alkalicoccus urumqiensis TaxID=1548213 RepID=A0A2P6MHM4_ALKUR|nr:hypothetical protein [Alkalicoccus urumqiensis]PRO65784.1 hypothetical protein C6I21_07760 [Alkalicoccus urumqiensis]
MTQNKDPFNRLKDRRAGERARTRSLSAFQRGLEERKSMPPGKKNSGWKAGVSTAAAAGIGGLLLAPWLIGTFQQADENEQEPEENDVLDENEEPEELPEENDTPLEDIIERPLPGEMNVNDLVPYTVFDEEIQLFVPDGWELEEETIDDGQHIYLDSGDAAMRIHWFTPGADAAFDEAVDRRLDQFDDEPLQYDGEDIKAHLEENDGIHSFYEDWFPVDDMTVYAVEDQKTGQLQEIITGTIFNRPVMVTSYLPLQEENTWSYPWEMLALWDITDDAYLLPGSGIGSAENDRPEQVEAALRIGGSTIIEETFRHVQLEEPQMSTYAGADSTLEEVDGDVYTAWRFTHENVGPESYYEISRMKEASSLAEAKEQMVASIGLSEEEIQNGLAPGETRIGYYIREEEQSDGFLTFFEWDNDWYFYRAHSSSLANDGGRYRDIAQFMFDQLERP